MNEQRIDKVNRLKVAEKERDNLTGSKNEAEAYLSKEREIQQKKNTLYQLLESTALKNCEDFGVRATQLTEKLTYERSKISSTAMRLKESQQKYERANQEHAAVENELHRSKSVRASSTLPLPIPPPLSTHSLFLLPLFLLPPPSHSLFLSLLPSSSSPPPSSLTVLV